MKMKIKQFNNITQNQIDKVIISLKKAGAVIRGNKLLCFVETNSHGVVFRCRYDPFGKILVVEIIEKNWYVSYNAVWDKINKAIGGKRNILGRIASALLL